MNFRSSLVILFLGLFVFCDTPFTPKPTNNEDLFKVNHNFEGGPRIISKAQITISWSEMTIPDFEKYVILRSVLERDEEIWEERGEITNPLKISFTDTLDDDQTFRYKVRMEDVSGNFREAVTEAIVFKTTSLIIPDEYESLQEAYYSLFIDDGDTIHVNSGLYKGSFELMNKEVTIRSVAGKEGTIFKQGGTIISMNRGSLSGFTFLSGGVTLSGTALMRDCDVSDIFTFDENHIMNTYDPLGNILESETIIVRRAGIVASDTASVINCTVSNGQKFSFSGFGGDGAGMIVSDHVTIRNCRITRNKTSERGGGIYVEGEPTIMNSIIDNNYAADGGGGIYLSLFAKPKIVNCIIYRNKSGLINGKSGTLLSDKGTLKMLNSIVWGNSSYGSEDRLWKNSSYSNIQSYSSGTGNISSLPLFVDPVSGDFHLQPDSPCIDAGHPGDEYRDVDGSRNDIGAYGGPFGNW